MNDELRRRVGGDGTSLSNEGRTGFSRGSAEEERSCRGIGSKALTRVRRVATNFVAAGSGGLERSGSGALWAGADKVNLGFILIHFCKKFSIDFASLLKV